MCMKHSAQVGAGFLCQFWTVIKNTTGVNYGHKPSLMHLSCQAAMGQMANHHLVDTHTVVSITQQLVNNMTKLPRDHRVLLDRKSASQTPEQLCTLVVM